MDLPFRYLEKLDQKFVRGWSRTTRASICGSMRRRSIRPPHQLEQQFAVIAEFSAALRAEAPHMSTAQTWRRSTKNQGDRRR